MRDTELYQHLLGVVAPWTVRTVELSVQDGRVDVWVEDSVPWSGVVRIGEPSGS